MTRSDAAQAQRATRRRILTCACCGGEAPAYAQWWNRDRGYGLCGLCAAEIQSEATHDPGEFRRSYGEPGIHWIDPQR